MLDPPDAAVALTQAGFLWVQLDGTQFFLKEATPGQLDALKASRSRNLSVQAAKKALRASALLTELQLDLNTLPSAAGSESVRARPVSSPAALTSPSNLAIVPFIKTVKPETEIPPSSDATFSLPRPRVSPALAAWYRNAWHRVTHAVAVIPLAFMYVALLYSMLGFAYLAAHPELLVQAAFSLLDLIPNYAAFASEAMWTQVKVELTARFR